MLDALNTFIGKRNNPDPAPLPALADDMRHMAGAGFAIHFTADYIDIPLHVTMWARHFDDTGIPWYAICREYLHMGSLRDLGIRAVWAPKMHHLHMAVAPSVKAIFYANNAHKNIEVLNRFPKLTHIQMLHGDSDKPASFSPVTSNFDKLFVAGQMGEDRYRKNNVTLPDQAFIHVGRPQVSGRQVGERAGWRDSPVIAYMPTWFGAKGDMMMSSLDRGADIIRAIRAAAPAAEILYKAHPMIYKDPSWELYEGQVNSAIMEVRAQSIDKDSDAGPVYDLADILVTDISSTMSDYLYSDRPLLTVLPRGYSPSQEERFPLLDGSYKVAKDLSDIDVQLNDALTEDSLAQRRAQMRKYAFGDDKRAGDARFIEAVRSIVEM